MTASLLSQLQQNRYRILGLARRFDFTISLTVDGAYEKLKSGDKSIVGLLVHEWTHYVQYLCTSLGNYMAELDRLILVTRLNLVISAIAALSGKPSLPVVQSIETETAVRADLRVRRHLSTLEHLMQSYNMLHCSWVDRMPDEKLNLDEIRRSRPFALDFERRALTFATTGAEKSVLPISALQLLEHAATANELLSNGGRIDKSYLTSSMADYFGLFIYLYQEGHIDIVLSGTSATELELRASVKGRVSNAQFFMFIYTCCQIALMLYDERFGEEENGVGSADDFAAARVRSSAGVLIKFLQNYDVVLNILLTDNGGKAKSILAALDASCGRLKLSSYSGMIAKQITRSQEALTKVREGKTPFSWNFVARNSNSLDDHDASFEGYFFKRSLSAFRALLESDGASVNPVSHADKFYSPYLLVETPTEARRLVVGFPWQESPMFEPIPSAILTHYRELFMVTDKVLLDADLACYLSTSDFESARVNRASFGCPHFGECFYREKRSLLDFCTFEDWRRIAEYDFDFLQRAAELLLRK